MVSCPKDNIYVCVFTGIDYRSYGVVVPYFTVNGATVTSSIDSQPDGSYHASMYYLIPPGDSVMFTMNASTPDLAPELTFSIYIVDLFFEIGNTKVSPVIPTGPDVCRLIVGDDRNCKG